MNRLDLNKAISIKQPWAYLICAGIKDVENRTWPLPKKYKGERIFIHASGKTDKEPYMLFSDDQINCIGDHRIMDVIGSYGMTSAIIGHVDIVDCVINYDSIWAEQSDMFRRTHSAGIVSNPPIYNWVLANPVLFDKPILNVKGKLSFWDCSEYLIQTELQPNTTD